MQSRGDSDCLVDAPSPASALGFLPLIQHPRVGAIFRREVTEIVDYISVVGGQFGHLCGFLLDSGRGYLHTPSYTPKGR